MDERKQMKNKEVVAGVVIGFIFGLLLCAGIAKFTYFSITKSAWTCTAIEQTGRNMDEVRCVRYDREKELKNEKTGM